MEKNYFYNLYKNIQKYNLKIDNNSYIINKINKLREGGGGGNGDVSYGDAKTNIDELYALLEAPAAELVQQKVVDPRDSLLEALFSEAEDFLKQFEEYKKNISSKIENITPDELQKLEEIEKTFNNIKTKIEQLI